MTELTIADVLQALLQFGAFGVLAWVVWHGLTKIIPDVLASFERNLNEQRQEFLEQLDKQQKTCEESQRLNREQLSAITEHINSHTIAVNNMATRVDLISRIPR